MNRTTPQRRSIGSQAADINPRAPLLVVVIVIVFVIVIERGPMHRPPDKPIGFPATPTTATFGYGHPITITVKITVKSKNV